jgi:hypothetical protein
MPVSDGRHRSVRRFFREQHDRSASALLSIVQDTASFKLFVTQIG